MKLKQACSMIYRLGFLLLYLWAFFTRAGGIVTAFQTPSVAFCSVFFCCILAVFLCSLMGNDFRAMAKVKSVCTAVALFLLVLHYSIWFTPRAVDWVFGVAAPFLLVLDWLLFDKKGVFRPLDVLFWLLGLLVFLALCMLLSGKPFGLFHLLSLLGIENNWLPAILGALAAGGLLYLLDRLLSGKKSSGLWDLFSLLYRLLFLALVAYALGEHAHYNLTEFLMQLTKFVPLFPFLSFLCIATVVLLCLVRFRSIHAQTPFPKVKGGFTAAAVLLLAGSRFVLQQQIPSGNVVDLILYFLCPMMMIFDWILFDAKGKWNLKDPLYWAGALLLYGLLVFLFGDLYGFYPALSRFSIQNLLGYGIFGTLACCYGVYLVDFLFKRK